jgi:F0F1-type ATP synthase assembly protein I
VADGRWQVAGGSLQFSECSFQNAVFRMQKKNAKYLKILASFTFGEGLRIKRTTNNKQQTINNKQ